MTLTIDDGACTRCGECAADCPSRSVQVGPDGSYAIDQDSCIHCAHCAAVCPADAVRSDSGPFPDWSEPRLGVSEVAALIRGKRSVRRYTSRAVASELLDEILRTGSLTSTASNSQDCMATVLTGERIAACRDGVRSLYALMARFVRNPFVRCILRFTEARRYVLRPRALEGLDRLAASGAGGADRLFFDAPVVVILSAPARHKRFGKTDCVLAGAHMMLHAQAAGLGSCMIGFAETALAMSARLRGAAGVPNDHHVNLVFTLGYPDVRYRRLPIRRPIEAF